MLAVAIHMFDLMKLFSEFVTSASSMVAQVHFVRPMTTALRSTFIGMICVTTLLSSGCEKKTAATDLTSQRTPGSTKPLEAADLVGYDGKRLRKSVDRIKDANEKHNQDLEKLSGSGPDQ
jgi:hypothetical protein